jgi:hypothetical protein
LPGKEFRCDVCGMHFVSKKEMDFHIKMAHRPIDSEVILLPSQRKPPYH